MKQYKISLISYLNSRPFLYGLERSAVKDEIRISLDIPSKTALKLVRNRADVGLVPVGALIDLPSYQVVSNFCIGAAGPVRTVILASEVPLDNIGTVLLDYQSRSSVLLAKVLSRFFWKREFNWEIGRAGFENKSIKGKTAGVVIGDRVFDIEKRYPEIIDLSAEWMKYTGLPFVFAVWVTPGQLPPGFTDRFNHAIAFGVKSVPAVEESEKKNYPGIDIYSYFTKNISYSLDEQKWEGMRLFLELAGKLNL